MPPSERDCDCRPYGCPAERENAATAGYEEDDEAAVVGGWKRSMRPRVVRTSRLMAAGAMPSSSSSSLAATAAASARLRLSNVARPPAGFCLGASFSLLLPD